MNHRAELIRINYQSVTARMEQAALSCGRSPSSVRIVVVTKAQPIEVVRWAIIAGARMIGENYPEESLPKIMALKVEFQVQWHMIGHLQSRKARLVAENFDFMESLDRLDLAEKLDRQLAVHDTTLPVLLEMNVGGEESKSGWNAQREQDWDSLLPDVEKILELPHLIVKGLMTMPPLFDQPDLVRPFFVQLVRLREFLAKRIPAADWSELSMGTSSDYEIAVQEGATLVRLGTAIVGPRPMKTV